MKDGKIALWGIILSACFTLLVKTGNLYNKNIQQQKQYEANKIAEQKKRTEDSANLVFQKNVAVSFNHSINELRGIDSSAKKNIEITNKVSSATEQNLNITSEVNAATTKNIQLAQEINNQTFGILNNTERGLYPLFPLYFVVTFKMEASDLDDFWEYMNKFKNPEKGQFSNQLKSEQYLLYKKNNPEECEQLQGLLNVLLWVTFTKKNLVGTDKMNLINNIKDSLVDFDKYNIFLDFSDRSLLVLLVFKFKKPTSSTTNNWKGEMDLENADFDVTISGKSKTQLSSFFIDHGSSSLLYGKCFFDLEDQKEIPWISQYKGTINYQESKNVEWCLQQQWLQRLFNEKNDQ